MPMREISEKEQELVIYIRRVLPEGYVRRGTGAR